MTHGSGQLAERLEGLVKAATPFVTEFEDKIPGRLNDPDWNPDFHIEISMSIAEGQALKNALDAALAKGAG